MKYLPLIFIAVKIFYFFNYRIIHRFESKLHQHTTETPLTELFLSPLEKKFLLMYLTIDILFLAYCIFLMFNPSTWTPAFLLINIDCILTASCYFKIQGACFIDPQDGTIYPSVWLRYLCFGASVYILFNLYYGFS